MPRRSPGAYLSAALAAVRLTLRGEQHPRARYPGLYAWIDECEAALRAVEQAAQQDKLDLALTLHIEGRNLSLKTLLQGIRFHLEQEYPSMLASGSQYALLAIKATNMNDHYAALRWSQSDSAPAATRAALGHLAEALAHHPGKEA